MLDAFGKGASEDIRMAKQELYAQVRGGHCVAFWGGCHCLCGFWLVMPQVPFGSLGVAVGGGKGVRKVQQCTPLLRKNVEVDYNSILKT